MSQKGVGRKTGPIFYTYQMKPVKKRKPAWLSAVICLGIIILFFWYLAHVMGTANMLQTLMNTAHDLLLNTVFYLMGICVLMGAFSKILLEYGVVDLIGKMLRPLMKPVFNLPGRASLGAVMTFLSDNPAIIGLAKDRKFGSYFKKYQLISLTNFGTAFGMGLIVIVFMVGQGFTWEPWVGFAGAIAGCIVSTRLMQLFVLKAHPEYKYENACQAEPSVAEEASVEDTRSGFQRFLDALLDGGKSGVEIGLAIIPGVLLISTIVMMLTFGASADGVYTGGAYEGTAILPFLAGKIDFVFDFLFGFKDPHLVAFPITSLGAVGAAIGMIPSFMAQGWIDGNAIAVCTAIGMCWSGFLSTHTAMLDSLGYRELTPKAIAAHTVGGLVAGIVAHLVYLLVVAII